MTYGEETKAAPRNVSDSPHTYTQAGRPPHTRTHTYTYRQATARTHTHVQARALSPTRDDQPCLNLARNANGGT